MKVHPYSCILSLHLHYPMYILQCDHHRINERCTRSQIRKTNYISIGNCTNLYEQTRRGKNEQQRMKSEMNAFCAIFRPQLQLHSTRYRLLCSVQTLFSRHSSSCKYCDDNLFAILQFALVEAFY